MQKVEKTAKPTNQRKLMLGGAIFIALLLLIIGFLFVKYHDLSKDPQAAAKATTKRIVERVGTLYEIPTDEEPTVAQVQDKAKLQGQVFFDKAQDGDYILVYSKNKLAMIYREKDNKLINVGPININSDDVKGQTTARTPVAFLNGSGSGGKLNAAVAKLTELSNQMAIQDTKPDAKNKNTAKTIVVDVSGQNAALAQAIADKLGATVEKGMPSGETVPNGAAVVVIVGKS